MRSFALAFFLALALAAEATPEEATLLADLHSFHSPAAPRSAEPSLAVAPDGTVWMSWFEKRDPAGHALRVARCTGNRWSAPVTVLESDSFFVNWADFPQLAPLGGERLAIAWLWRHAGGEAHAYDVRVAFSDDGGAKWGPPIVPHRDGTATEHGFVSMIPSGDGVQMVWLDGRKFAVKKPAAAKPAASQGHDGHDGEMTVRGARVGRDGRITEEAEIDARVCDCCNTAAVAIPGGALLAYRDRSDKEVRDISVARFQAGRWGAPAALHADGWKTPACPVNGPALDADGAKVVAAWFALVDDSARVQVAFSNAAGARFGSPIPLESNDPLGRMDVAMLADGSAIVLWLDAFGKDALVKAQHVFPDGRAEPAVTVGRTSAARASGFPRIVRGRDRVLFAWTEPGPPSRIRMALARTPGDRGLAGERD